MIKTVPVIVVALISSFFMLGCETTYSYRPLGSNGDYMNKEPGYVVRSEKRLWLVTDTLLYCPPNQSMMNVCKEIKVEPSIAEPPSNNFAPVRALFQIPLDKQTIAVRQETVVRLSFKEQNKESKLGSLTNYQPESGLITIRMLREGGAIFEDYLLSEIDDILIAE